MADRNSRSTSPAQAWVRAIQNTSGLDPVGNSTLPGLIDSLAVTFGGCQALQSEHQCLTYDTLAERCNQYARWALAQGLGIGDTVCLVASNRAEYPAIWLGISYTGCTVALINAELRQGALAHALRVASASLILVDPDLVPAIQAVFGELTRNIPYWTVGEGAAVSANALLLVCSDYSGLPLSAKERPIVPASTTALLVFTSGTTGRPKAAKLSHYRVLEWSLWFAGMADTGPGDRLYNCLPLYHSTGGVACIGAILVKGGSVVIRKRFSARLFWQDVSSERCTLFLYIGELCRYLLAAPVHGLEHCHQLRLCVGNGLRSDVWGPFLKRFNIPSILEFYASTEGNVAFYNIEGQVGSVGRIPRFLPHRNAVAVIALRSDTGEPDRGEDGFCKRCGPGVIGEAIGKINSCGLAGPTVFEGYTDTDATTKKILRDVFEVGDAWFRTGDLMRYDQAGFHYFVDRLGDTFRWKGENVSTAEVAEAACGCPGVLTAVVFGVTVPGLDGKAGMAAITVGPSFDLRTFHKHLSNSLPPFARPPFLRICTTLDMTPTFKPVKVSLTAQGYRSAGHEDAIFVADLVAGSFRALDSQLILQIEQGSFRL